MYFLSTIDLFAIFTKSVFIKIKGKISRLKGNILETLYQAIAVSSFKILPIKIISTA